MFEGIVQAFHDAVSGFSNAVFVSVIKEDRYTYLVDGLLVSLQLTLIAAAIGVVIGLLVAVAKLQNLDSPSKNAFTRGLRKWIVGIANGYVSIIRGTPAVVQLLVIYFIIFGRVLQPIFPGVPDIMIASIAFGINSGAYVAEIIRAGIMAVDKGQTEAGRSLGLSSVTTMMFIVIPQAVKNVLPALVNELIVLFKETSVAGYIGLTDLTKGATTIGAVAYDYMIPLLCAAYIYFIITTVMTAGMNKLERRMRRGD